MLSTAHPPAERAAADAADLVALVDGVAHKDPGALAHLYDLLAPAVTEILAAALPDPADAAAITSATFVELWWMARFHTAPETDVHAWIAGIAARRAEERLRAIDTQPQSTAAKNSHTNAGPHPLSRSILAIDDQRHTLALAELLKPHAGRVTLRRFRPHPRRDQ